MGISGRPVAKDQTWENRKTGKISPKHQQGSIRVSDGRRRPSECLPVWARAYFDRARSHFDEMEMVPTASDGTELHWKCSCDLEPGETLTPTHRHKAFTRLFCTDTEDMRRMWKRADEVVVIDLTARPVPEDGRWFLGGALIYGTDAAIQDQKLRTPLPLTKLPPQRLSPEQRAARKVARLLQCLLRATLRDCFAASRNSQFDGMVRELENRYDLELGPFDYSRFYRVYDLAYTRDSKRGWIQRRRAHDRIRHEVIAAMRRLVETTRTPGAPLIEELSQIANDLATWPDMKTEHGHQLEMLSQKGTWADWLRYAYDQWRDALEWGGARGHLRQSDWATLAATLSPEYFDDGDQPDESLVRTIIAEVETTRPERERITREKVLAEDAAFRVALARRDE